MAVKRIVMVDARHEAVDAVNVDIVGVETEAQGVAVRDHIVGIVDEIIERRIDRVRKGDIVIRRHHNEWNLIGANRCQYFVTCFGSKPRLFDTVAGRAHRLRFFVIAEIRHHDIVPQAAGLEKTQLRGAVARPIVRRHDHREAGICPLLVIDQHAPGGIVASEILFSCLQMDLSRRAINCNGEPRPASVGD